MADRNDTAATKGTSLTVGEGWRNVQQSVRDLVRRILLGAPGAQTPDPTAAARTKWSRHGAFLSAYGYGPLADFLRIDDELISCFVDYEEMDISGEICSAALDIYADDSTIPNYQTGKTVSVTSKDEGIRATLDRLLNAHISIDDYIWDISRNLCKYGNAYLEIALNEAKRGVALVNQLPPATMRAVIDDHGMIAGYLQTFSPYRTRMAPDELYRRLKDQREKDAPASEVVFEPFEIAHFKIGSAQRYNIYGMSVLEPARWVWRRLILMEDSILIYRLTRAPSRYVFYVDVGERPPREAMAYLNEVKDMYKKRKFVNQEGRLDFKYNPLSNDEDFFIPVRNGKKGTEIDVLTGPAYSYVEDVDYFKDKLLAALKVPKAYMSFTEDLNRATLSSLDVRFARSVMQIQRELRNGLRQVCDVHLASFGIIPDRSTYNIEMTTPSSILELAQLEIMKTRADVAEKMGELFPPRWLLVHVFGLSEDDAEAVVNELAGSNTDVGSMPSGGAGAEAGSEVFASPAETNPTPSATPEPLPPELAAEVPPQTPGRLSTPVPPRGGRVGLPPELATIPGMPEGVSRAIVGRGRRTTFRQIVDSRRSRDTEIDKRMERGIKQLLANDLRLQRRIEGVARLMHDISASRKR